MRSRLTDEDAIKMILNGIKVYYFDEYKREFIIILSLYEISELMIKDENEINITYWGENYEI